jgi:hypothetical protein
VLTERPECLFGAVGRGGKAIGAHPDPRQEGNEGDPVEDLAILKIPGPAEEKSLQLLEWS